MPCRAPRCRRQVAYSDPQSGVFLGSPSIARLDADTLLISHVRATAPADRAATARAFFPACPRRRALRGAGPALATVLKTAANCLLMINNAGFLSRVRPSQARLSVGLQGRRRQLAAARHAAHVLALAVRAPRCASEAGCLHEAGLPPCSDGFARMRNKGSLLHRWAPQPCSVLHASCLAGLPLPLCPPLQAPPTCSAWTTPRAPTR